MEELNLPKLTSRFYQVSPKVADAENEEKEKLGSALRDLQQEELRDMKMRQWIRQNSDELRILDSKLKMAYVNKALAMQIEEKKAKALEEKIKDKFIQKKLTSAYMSMEEMLLKENEEKAKKKHEYLMELQDQIISREKEKITKYEQFLNEKKQIDDIILRIIEEDEAEYQSKMCKIKRTREEIQQYKIAQLAWKEKEKQRLIEENQKLLEYAIQKEMEQRQRKQNKAENEAKKQEFLNAMSQKMNQKITEKKEREEILADFLQLEQNEASELIVKKELENKIRMRIDIRQTYIEQMLEKEEKIKQEAFEDARFKEQLLAKAMEDEKIQQLTKEKKRLKQIQLRKDIDLTIQMKKERLARDLEMNYNLERQLELEKEKRQQLIEQERIKLIKEHAHNVIGYLPTGVLRPGDEVYINSILVENNNC